MAGSILNWRVFILVVVFLTLLWCYANNIFLDSPAVMLPSRASRRESLALSRQEMNPLDSVVTLSLTETETDLDGADSSSDSSKPTSADSGVSQRATGGFPEAEQTVEASPLSQSEPTNENLHESQRSSEVSLESEDDSTVADLARRLRETLDLPNDAQPWISPPRCGHINYSENIYPNFKPCRGAKCKQRFDRTVEVRLEDILFSPQYQLTGSQLDTILSLGRHIPEDDVIIASAASSNHYNEMQMMFKNLHETVFPALKNFQMVLFDIGLSPEQRIQTEKSCKCQVISFDFSLFPAHVSDLHCYAWKPFIIRALAPKARKLIIWQDASVRWSSKFTVILDRARVYGLQVYLGSHKVTANTLHETFQYMQEPECLFEAVPEICNALAIYRADHFNELAILTPWARCALEKRCMCPQDPRKVRSCNKTRPQRCHRFDQSALTLLLGKLYYDERYKVEIPDRHKHVRLMRGTLAPDYFQGGRNMTSRHSISIRHKT